MDFAHRRGNRARQTGVTAFAVIADPHFHDTDYAGAGGAPFLRTLVDTAESTRVFNESAPAFRAALDDVAARGIKLVVIVGDLTDDGQGYALDGALALLEDYSARFGMRFFMTPGNHDLFARGGRHQSKRILRADGGYDLVTSDLDAVDAGAVERIVTPAMYCGGYDTNIVAMARLGFMRQAGDLHWESPFGGDDAIAARLYDVVSEDGALRAQMVDASYLVEPEEGLWLLSLDANVYRPSATGFFDSSEAGWNAALVHKPFLLDWAADVAARARLLGKKLVVFSHYPVVDPLDGTHVHELALLGTTTFARRMPDVAVSQAFVAAGVRCHFSGHWHINDTARFGEGAAALVNIAVPAPVAFPPAYKICALDGDRLAVETVMLRAIAGFDVGFERYAAERALTGYDAEGLDDASDHFGFISRHLALLVRDRYLPREWPKPLRAALLGASLGEVALRVSESLPSAIAELADLPFMQVIIDWYRLRKASDLALVDIDPKRLAAYAELVTLFTARDWPEGSIEQQLAIFARMLDSYRNGLPATRFEMALG